MRIGVLAVQGAFAEHEQMLDRLCVEHFQIRQRRDLDQPFDGIIFPGGESTVMGKLLRELDLFEPIRNLIQKGLPVFGTCAGMILLAQEIDGSQSSHLGSVPIKVRRNASGRQIGSYKTMGEFAGAPVPMVFIRAPYVESLLGDAEVLSVISGNIVAARYGNRLVTSFHPELTEDISVHRYFLDMVKRYLEQKAA